MKPTTELEPGDTAYSSLEEGGDGEPLRTVWYPVRILRWKRERKSVVVLWLKGFYAGRRVEYPVKYIRSQYPGQVVKVDV